MVNFVGGCYVTGYPVGYEYSFVNIIKKRYELEVNFIPRPVSAKNSLKEVQKICANSGGSDDLVLQLGNYEANFSIRPKFLKRSSSTSVEDSSKIQKDVFYSEKAINALIGGFYRVPLSCIYEIFKISTFDKNLIKYHLNKLFNWMSLNYSGNVYILSAFPSLNPATNIYRKWASNLLKKCQ